MIYLVLFCSVCCNIIAAVILYRELYAINLKILHLQEEIRQLKTQCVTVSPQPKKKKRVRVITPNRVF